MSSSCAAKRVAVNFGFVLEVRIITPSLCTPACPRMAPAWHETRLSSVSLLYRIDSVSVVEAVCLRAVLMSIPKL